MRILALFAVIPALLSPVTAHAQDAPPASDLADAYQLANADGDRVCPMTLKADAAGGGYAISFDKAACADAIDFTVDVTNWSPGAGASIRLLGAKGVLVAEFTEGVAGNYEALIEGKGVYFLTNLRLADPAKQPQPAEQLGAWDAERTAGKPICRMTFTDEPTDTGGNALKLAPDCAASIARFAPVSWRIERGDLVLSSAKGEKLRFALRDGGGWTKVPESSRPLVLTRPDAPPGDAGPDEAAPVDATPGAAPPDDAAPAQ